MTVVEVQVAALARVAPELAVLGALVKLGTSTAVPEADAAADSPSLSAIRAVSAHTIPDVRSTVADRFVAVGTDAQQVAVEFAKTSGSLVRTEADVTAAMTGSGSLLPPAR